MILEIRGVAKQEEQKEQRLVFKVIADGNLSDYAVVDNTYKDGIPSDLHKHYYSFPNYSVKKDEYVILYTYKGINSKEEQKGITYHFFYWGLDISVWNKVDTAHLLKIVASSDRRIAT